MSSSSSSKYQFTLTSVPFPLMPSKSLKTSRIHLEDEVLKYSSLTSNIVTSFGDLPYSSIHWFIGLLNSTEFSGIDLPFSSKRPSLALKLTAGVFGVPSRLIFSIFLLINFYHLKKKTELFIYWQKCVFKLVARFSCDVD